MLKPPRYRALLAIPDTRNQKTEINTCIQTCVRDAPRSRSRDRRINPASLDVLQTQSRGGKLERSRASLLHVIFLGSSSSEHPYACHAGHHHAPALSNLRDAFWVKRSPSCSCRILTRAPPHAMPATIVIVSASLMALACRPMLLSPAATLPQRGPPNPCPWRGRYAEGGKFLVLSHAAKQVVQGDGVKRGASRTSFASKASLALLPCRAASVTEGPREA